MVSVGESYVSCRQRMGGLGPAAEGGAEEGEVGWGEFGGGGGGEEGGDLVGGGGEEGGEAVDVPGVDF